MIYAGVQSYAHKAWHESEDIKIFLKRRNQQRCFMDLCNISLLATSDVRLMMKSIIMIIPSMEDSYGWMYVLHKGELTGAD